MNIKIRLNWYGIYYFVWRNDGSGNGYALQWPVWVTGNPNIRPGYSSREWAAIRRR